MKDAKEIFVAYASANETQVRNSLKHEFGAGFQTRCFFAPESLRPGTPFPEEIEAQLAHCRTFVLCWSAAASSSEWVKREFTLALDRANTGNLRFEPWIFDDTPLPSVVLDRFHVRDARVLRHRLKVLWLATREGSWTGFAVAIAVPLLLTLVFLGHTPNALIWSTILVLNTNHLIWALHHLPHVPRAAAADLTADSLRNLRTWLRQFDFDRPMATGSTVRHSCAPLGGELGSLIYWTWAVLAALLAAGTISFKTLFTTMVMTGAAVPFTVAALANFPVIGNVFPAIYSTLTAAGLAAVIGTSISPGEPLVHQVAATSLPFRVSSIMVVCVALGVGIFRFRENRSRLDAEARWFLFSVAVFAAWLGFLVVVHLPYRDAIP